jgi:hypothetical protein
MSGDEQYATALERSEVAARNNGHRLGAWQVVSEHLHASQCEACGAMVWVVRPAYHERWRVGGTALATGTDSERKR